MSTRIGIDVGGTFTDLIFYDETSCATRIAKAPTTADSPDKSCMSVIKEAVGEDRLASAEFFLHGTTVGLNAILERKGSAVGLLCTQGFRDLLEIRRGDRAEMYNLFWQLKDPIVSRRFRLPVAGRIMADGSERAPLSIADIRAAFCVFERHKIDSIAICFMNAYANPRHELDAEQALRSLGFAGNISLSHRVSGEYHEYERTSTSVIDAFVKARLNNYLQRLKTQLSDCGFSGMCLITRSGGGAMTFDEASARSFETLMSGPVAGAEGAAEIARRMGIEHLISADVGGTSFDACLISQGRPKLLFEGRIDDMPLQTPWVDVRSIGAGGGSMAYIDRGGLLRVGPQSAGAAPGPACYGQGGAAPCVTDAALWLGMLGDGRFESGLTLNVECAQAALTELGGKLQLSADDVARGIMQIACTAMANTIKEIALEDGLDPRQMPLLAFGGAGPLLATLIADELDSAQIIVPPHAGNFSAWGMLGADLVRSLSRTRIMPLTENAVEEANNNFADLFKQLDEGLEKDTQTGNLKREIGLEMRFIGQEHTLTVMPQCDHGRIASDPAALRALFLAQYASTFGMSMDDPLEIVSLRATLRRALPARNVTATASSAGDVAAQTFDAYSFAQGRRVSFSVVDRAVLLMGTVYEGPMIVREATTSSYIDAGYKVTIDAHGCMIIGRTG